MLRSNYSDVITVSALVSLRPSYMSTAFILLLTCSSLYLTCIIVIIQKWFNSRAKSDFLALTSKFQISKTA